MALPKVLVGCPTYENKRYCLNEYLRAAANLAYTNFDLVLVDNSPTTTYYDTIKQELTKLNNPRFSVIKDDHLDKAKDRIVHSRNILRDKTLKDNYDYFLSLEQDIIPPPNVIEALLAHRKPVVTGLYFKEYLLLNKTTNAPERVALPLAYHTAPDGQTLAYVQPDEIDQRALIKITGCGLGCILIHRSVLEHVTFRHNPQFPAFDDMYFCNDCERLGIPIYADTNVRCTHLHKKTDWTTIT